MIGGGDGGPGWIPLRQRRHVALVPPELSWSAAMSRVSRHPSGHHIRSVAVTPVTSSTSSKRTIRRTRKVYQIGNSPRDAQARSRPGSAYGHDASMVRNPDLERQVALTIDGHLDCTNALAASIVVPDCIRAAT